MEKFPTIDEHQVVVMRADLLTGNILDENFNLVISDFAPIRVIGSLSMLLKEDVDLLLGIRLHSL